MLWTKSLGIRLSGKAASLLAVRRIAYFAAVERVLTIAAAPLALGSAWYLAREFLTSGDLAYRGSLVIAHVMAAVIAIGFGGLQFIPEIRIRWPLAHRWIGRAYVGASLLNGSSALFIAAQKSLNAAAYGLVITATLWIITTLFGFWAIRRRFFAVHRRWMIRSYALACTAVTLRLYERAMAHLGITDPTFVNAFATWAALMSNLALAEGVARTGLFWRSPPSASL
jgi:hypothetical protein